MRAYIFDLDGTLSDTLSSIAFYCNQALKKFGFCEIETERYKQLVGNGRDLLIHRALTEVGADTPENFINVCTEYDKLYEADVICLAKPYDGIIKMLNDLKTGGNKIAVLSNKPHNVTVPIVKELFGDIFDAVYGARDGVELKPKPGGALKLAEELGVSPSDCVFIGDTDNDILTGVNAGMKTIGVLWGFRDETELRDAGADYIVNKAHEITEIALR